MQRGQGFEPYCGLKQGVTSQNLHCYCFPSTMPRRERSYTPDSSNKRVRPSHRSSPRSPSPTRRNAPRPSNRSRYDDERNRERERDRDRYRERDRDRDRDRYRDDRYRDDRRRDSHREGRDDRRDDRRRSRSRDRASTPSRPPAQDSAAPTPPQEDDKIKAKRAKLEAWKREREAKKALDEAKAKAMALAGKAAPGEFCLFSLNHHGLIALDLMPISSPNKNRPTQSFRSRWFGPKRSSAQARVLCCQGFGINGRLRRD